MTSGRRVAGYFRGRRDTTSIRASNYPLRLARPFWDNFFSTLANDRGEWESAMFQAMTLLEAVGVLKDQEGRSDSGLFRLSTVAHYLVINETP